MAKPLPRPIPPAENLFWPNAISVLTGFFLALVLLKFGNPVIFESTYTTPADIFELIFQTWPLAWGYGLVALLAAVGLKTARWKIDLNRTTAFGLLLPLIWLTWQFISATQTVDAKLTSSTLKQFVACTVCFYLGWFSLGQTRQLKPVFLGALIGLSAVIVSGWQQHFGGLEQTRRFFYELPNWREFPPEFLQKVASNRIYSTLFYPNTLAAALLLFFPISLAALWTVTTRWTIAARRVLAGLLAIGTLGCLVWSGSKSGWLLALLMILIGLLHLKFSPNLKKMMVIGLLIVGLGGFFVKYANFFQRGATSVGARFDYWRAAVEITKTNPILGTGPGTFFVPYQKIKKPEAEMARLCHNDYLQQASDSGIVGLLSFATLIFGSLLICRPRFDRTQPFRFAIWLGVVGVSLHSLVEFNLYIPAIAWPTFLFLGWLWSQKETIDKSRAAS